MTPILQLNNVVFTYPGALEPAIKIEYLELEQGKTLVLMGSSGAGKTTALRLIAGLQDSQSGSITLDGVVLTGVAPEKRGIGLVFQNPMLFPFLNTIENVGFGLRANKALKLKSSELAMAALDLVGMANFAQRAVQTLSGGQAQRVALARALVLAPKVLMLDEPLAALDVDIRAEMQELILKIKQNLGMSLILVTHDQREASVLSDVAALMKNGQILQLSSMANLLQRPKSLEVYRTMGGVNEIPGLIKGDNFHSLLGDFQLPSSLKIKSGEATLVFRQEAAKLGSRMAMNESDYRISGRIESIRKVGYRTELSIAIASGIIRTETPDNFGYQEDQEISLYIPTEDLCFLGSENYLGEVL